MNRAGWACSTTGTTPWTRASPTERRRSTVRTCSSPATSISSRASPPRAPLLGKLANGWAISGVTVLQSGQPYNAYDYSGAVAGLYYANTIKRARSRHWPGARRHAAAGGVAGNHRDQPRASPPSMRPSSTSRPLPRARLGVPPCTDQFRWRAGLRHLRDRFLQLPPQCFPRPLPGAVRRCASQGGEVARTVHVSVQRPGVQHLQPSRVRCPEQQFEPVQPSAAAFPLCGLPPAALD